MRAMLRCTVVAMAMWSGAVLAIPPSLPEDAERQAEAERQRQETIANLESPEAQDLIELFFARIGEGEGFDVGEIFAADAVYLDAHGDLSRISENLDDDGFPDIRQWESIAVFRLANSWGVAARARSDQFFINEALLKFFFSRDSSGALKISRIEEVAL